MGHTGTSTTSTPFVFALGCAPDRRVTSIRTLPLGIAEGLTNATAEAVRSARSSPNLRQWPPVSAPRRPFCFRVPRAVTTLDCGDCQRTARWVPASVAFSWLASDAPTGVFRTLISALAKAVPRG
jgi:hypothetical protein